MPVIGIIAEYNPFHLGHAYQIKEARRLVGADSPVVAVMSGNFVQRGEAALLHKHARAEAAVRCGADLVLELPTAWAAATAEVFARGGVALLAAAGVVTHLCFGSECADLVALEQTAACLDGGAYRRALGRRLERGGTFAAARQAAAEEAAGPSARCLARPNDALAVEYLRALRALGAPMTPLAVRRVGAAHDSDEAGEGFASASAIRRRILAGEPWERLVPPGSAAVLKREMGAGRAPVSMAACERMLLSRLRAMEEEAFHPYDGGNAGLYHRFYRAVRRAAGLEELLDLAKTRRYTHARLRRLALSAWLGVEQPAGLPPYLRVLSANSRGCGLLKEMKTRSALPVLTKPGDVRALGEAARRRMEEESRCTDLYTLAWPAPGRAGREYAAGPVILSSAAGGPGRAEEERSNKE